MSKYNICNNCGKNGHMFNQCKIPITSYGIIAYRINVELNIPEYLMICRKDSYSYIAFIRGKYKPYDYEQVSHMFNHMSRNELSKIKDICEKYGKYAFFVLWRLMWIGDEYVIHDETLEKEYNKIHLPIHNHKQTYREENSGVEQEISSERNFMILMNGINHNNITVTLFDFIYQSTSQWMDPEWEFPKGRRNYREYDLNCALREFQEETGIIQKDICLIENINPFEEIYIGSNYKSYKHKYYLAYVNNSVIIQPPLNNGEVSKIEWKPLDKCLSVIRPYNKEKQKLIINIDKLLKGT